MATAPHRLTRRQFVQDAGVVALGLFAGCQPPWSRPPPAARSATLGFLVPGNAPGPKVRIDAFRQGLAEQGYVEGQNLAIEFRFAAGQLEQLPTLAAELVDERVDVLFASSAAAAKAARAATTRVPLVMVADGDPVGLGLVASFAHPGGNLTGVSNMATELSGKRLQLLTEVAPQARRVAVLWNSTRADMAARVQEIRTAAQVSDVTLLPDPLTEQHQRRILILHGAQPAELPIAQAMTFDFAINLNPAQALGLTIPQHVLLQATEIIQ